MGACDCCNKLFLIILNFVVLILGIALITVASIVINSNDTYKALLIEDGLVSLPIIVLILGILIFLLGFFGCCGAGKESPCMLYTYAIVVTLLFVAGIVLGVLIFVYPNVAKSTVKEAMTKTFKKYDSQDKALKKAIDSLQHDSECCGVNGPDDWRRAFSLQQPPLSCCKDPTSCDTNDDSTLFSEGCFEAIYEDLKSNGKTIGLIAIFLAIVQAFCICTACGLAQKNRSMMV